MQNRIMIITTLRDASATLCAINSLKGGGERCRSIIRDTKSPHKFPFLGAQPNAASVLSWEGTPVLTVLVGGFSTAP